MTLIRIQGSDFQDGKTTKDNLDKLVALEEHAKYLTSSGYNVAGLDLVGDFNDMHFIIGLQQELMQNPEIQKMLSGEADEELQKKYQKDPAFLMAFVPEYQKQWISKLYQEQQKVLEDAGVNIYGVLGNNDPNHAKDILKAVRFTDLEAKLIEEGPFRIIGASNTNYENERIFPDSEPDDDDDIEKSKAYQALNLKKTEGKKANILQLHGPPDGINFRVKDGEERPCGAKGIPKLIEDHNPQLVECGHFHTAEIATIDGVTYARSSPNYYFEHHFDDKGNYVETDIYKYAA